MSSPGARRLKRFEPFAVIASYAVIACVHTYPLCLQFRDHVPGGFRDVWHHLWRHWLVSYSVTELGRLPFHTELAFYPVGQTLASADFNPFVEVCFVGLLRVFDLTVGFNLFLVMSLVLSAFGAYVLVRDRYGDRRAAFVAGLIFGFSPIMTAMIDGGWLQHVFAVWIPLYVLTLYRLAEPDRRAFKWVPASAVLLTLAMLTSLYNGPALVLLGGLFLAFELARKNGLRLAGRWLASVGIAAVATVLLAMPRLVESVRYPSRVPRPSNALSADLLSFFWPFMPPEIDGWHASSRFYATPFVGWTVLALLAIAILRRRACRFWLAATAMFFVFSLGPFLKIAGTTVFSALGKQWIVPLPWYLLHWVPPFYRLANHHRFATLMMLAVAIAVAPTLVAILNRPGTPRRRNVATAGLAALILFEFTVLEAVPFPRPMTSTEVPALYAAIASEPDDFAIAELPDGILGKSLFHQTVHRRPVLFASPERARRRWGPNPVQPMELVGADGAARAELLERLRWLRIKYLVVHDEFLEQPQLCAAVHATLRELLGDPVYRSETAAAYATYREPPVTTAAEEARRLADLATLSFGFREYEIALDRIERAIALAPRPAYESLRAEILRAGPGGPR